MTNRLAFKLKLPLEMQQLGNQMLDMEGLCVCGRVITRWEGKFLLAPVMPSKEITILAAYCQPCSQVINRTLLSLRTTAYLDKTESVKPTNAPTILTDVG